MEDAPMTYSRRQLEENQSVFLTLTTADHKPWLRANNVRELVLEALHETWQRCPFVPYGHVLLDDHVHLLVRPVAGTSIADLVGDFKRTALAKLPMDAQQRSWQPHYHDHVICDEDDFARHLDYMHFNPVKHGLTNDAGAWRWSSLAVWQSRGVYPNDWGRCEPERIRGMTEQGLVDAAHARFKHDPTWCGPVTPAFAMAA
jgi:putative transposase